MWWWVFTFHWNPYQLCVLKVFIPSWYKNCHGKVSSCFIKWKFVLVFNGKFWLKSILHQPWKFSHSTVEYYLWNQYIQEKERAFTHVEDIFGISESHKISVHFVRGILRLE